MIAGAAAAAGFDGWAVVDLLIVAAVGADVGDDCGATGDDEAAEPAADFDVLRAADSS